MKITHDRKFHLMYIRLTGHEVERTEEVLNGEVIIDFDADGKIIGIELLDVAHVPTPEQIEYEDITHQTHSEES